MKLRKLYETVVELGMEVDPRGKKSVQKNLKRAKKKYEELNKEEKEFFDTEALTNPYSDTRILHGTGDEDIKTALIGVDMEVGELLLADRLNSKGTKVDLVIAHHPEGKAFANLYDVMYMQADILNRFGVPINAAEGRLEGRIREVERRLLPVNHSRASDAARLLDMPFMCMHTPTDNMVASYLQKTIDRKKPDYLDDIMKILFEIPEYRDAAMNGAGPKLLLGSNDRTAGKVFVDMTGGTEGAKDIFESIVNSGVSTIIAMHLSEEHRKEAEKHHLNVIIAGHISSDNLGINLMLDAVQKKNKLKVLECSGFKRFERKK